MNQSLYAVIYVLAYDKALRARVTACVYEQARVEGADIADPEEFMEETKWEWASTPGWAELVGEASEEGIPQPTANPNVITDDDLKSRINNLVLGV